MTRQLKKEVAMRMQGKVAIITGGGQGIGKEFSLAFAGQGAAVVIGQRNVARAEATAEQIRAKGGKALAVRLDIAEQAQCDNIVKNAVAAFGGVDILLNNAALLKDYSFASWDSWTDQEWLNSFNVNVVGGWRMTKSVFPCMKERGKGKIINVSSTTVQLGFSGMLPYTSSKAAVVANTRVLARALGRHNININCLALGYTATEAITGMASYTEAGEMVTVKRRCLQRKQKPDDPVGTAIYLACDDSDFVTGQVLVVDGGEVWTAI